MKLAKTWLKLGHLGKANGLFCDCLNSLKYKLGNSSLEVGVVLFYMGEASKDEPEKARKRYLDALHILQQNKSSFILGMQGLVHNGLSKVYNQTNELKKAYEHNYKAAVLFENFRSNHRRFCSLQISGKGKYKLVKEMLVGEDWTARLIGSMSRMLNAMCSIYHVLEVQQAALMTIYKFGMICENIGRMNEAFHCLYSTLVYNQQISESNGSMMSKCLFLLGKIYKNWNDCENSLPCIEEYFSISSQHTVHINHEHQLETMSILSELCFEMHLLQEAQSWNEGGLKLLRKSDTPTKTIKFLTRKVRICL